MNVVMYARIRIHIFLLLASSLLLGMGVRLHRSEMAFYAFLV